MAEATKDKDNPFSFKSFIKRSSADVGSLLEQRDREGKTGRKKKEARSNSSAADVLFPEVEEPKKEDADNPFSFTKFVKTKKTKKHNKSVRVTDDLFSDDSNSEQDELFSTSKETPHQAPSPSTRTQTISKLDIFESDSDSSFSVTEEDSLLFNKSSNIAIDLGPPLTATPTTRHVPNGKTLLLVSEGNKEEDSDSSDSSLDESSQTLPRLLPGKGEGAQLRKLRAENEQLREQLTRSLRDTKTQEEKNTSLQRELETLRKKEKEDTRALEDMVQRVESNLVATTKRAAIAENTIAKLKQEILSLQAQLALASPQCVQQRYDETMRGVREKANYASQQLVTASQKAEQSIRELVGGVETLKTVAEILTCIDSMTEIKDKTTNS